MASKFNSKRRNSEKVITCICCGHKYFYDETLPEPNVCVNCQDSWWRKDD